ncbi:3-hydroxybutyrate dehydrogenase [Oxalobacteraceae bacterium R-40]|uniref:3-hydroxybutyrate dehydrogenase n=1 Tax=Keguizhuia sedimenti TaxID=3064264 RepID=A0ABU1BME2_9BURK|nr:3-hydroxybutyrate dehydrogenase [Oxalobacteraceae bacterium R-40]
MQKNSLQGKNAIITGSTSGIGLGIAQALAAQGANIVLNGFGDSQEIASLKDEFTRQYGIQAIHHPADLAKPEQITDLIQESTRQIGHIDILVNNAGIQYVANIEDFPVDRWDAIIAINLSSAFHTTRLVLPAMKSRGWGRIINIASAHGLVASAQKSAYVAAKHGIIGLTKAVALETAQSNITCNAICPGWVLTPLVQKQVDDRAAQEDISVEEAKRALLSEKQPSGEFVTPAQLGALSVFLCSEEAAQVRGAAWNMDGGWLAQ